MSVATGRKKLTVETLESVEKTQQHIQECVTKVEHLLELEDDRPGMPTSDRSPRAAELDGMIKDLEKMVAELEALYS